MNTSRIIVTQLQLDTLRHPDNKDKVSCPGILAFLILNIGMLQSDFYPIDNLLLANIEGSGHA